MKKLSVLVVGAAGYVLGSRAGRERYEQIKRQATKAWNKPVVQDAADTVEQAVKSTASDVGSKIADAASDAGSKVVHKVKGDKSAEAAEVDADDPASENMFPKQTPASGSGGASF
jgi:hypothetical protein